MPWLSGAFTRLEPEPPFLDEWESCRIQREQDIRDEFVPSFYFGCEADDPGVALAFDTRINPLGAKLSAMFSSDLGHLDVPDMTGILGEAYELVDHELLDERAFRDFVFANPARFYTRLNPDFFAGTRVESEVAKLLGAGSSEARRRGIKQPPGRSRRRGWGSRACWLRRSPARAEAFARDRVRDTLTSSESTTPVPPRPSASHFHYATRLAAAPPSSEVSPCCAAR